MAIYKVTITKIDKEMVTSRNYVQVDPFKNKRGEVENYDYRTEEKEEEVSHVIFDQRVEELNIADVVSVVNKLNK